MRLASRDTQYRRRSARARARDIHVSSARALTIVHSVVLQASKMGLAGTHPGGLPFFCPNGDHLTQPPPAHMGIPPYGALDAGKAAAAAGEYHWPSVTQGQPPEQPWKHLLTAAASTGQPHPARFATGSRGAAGSRARIPLSPPPLCPAECHRYLLSLFGFRNILYRISAALVGNSSSWGISFATAIVSSR